MRKLLLATTAILVGMPTVAFAQAAPASQAQPTPTAAGAGAETATGSSEQAADGQAAPTSQGLNDIVVTAQRRSENLQRAAVAVDVVSGSDIAAAGVTQVARLNEQVPALTVEPTSTGNLIFIRGVGNFTVTPNSDPATAFNYDGVYVGRPTGTTGVFFDLERIEVLKGPQGTLYGRNATGGAINVIPVQPKIGELSGYGSVSYGDYNALIAEAAVNVPIGQDGALRVSGNYARHDGYLRDGTGDEKLGSLRVQLKAQLTPDLTVRVAGDYSHSGGLGTSVSYAGNYVYSAATTSYTFRPSNLPLDEGLFTPAAQAFRETVNAGPAGRKLSALDISPFQNNNFYGTNAQIDYKTGFGTLTVVPAFRYADLDYLSTGSGFGYRQREKDEQESIETRFTGDRIGAFEYTLGIFYYHEQVRAIQALSTAAADTFSTARYTTDSYAPFGRLTAHIASSLRLVGGVRYTNDHKTFVGDTTAGSLVCTARVAGVASCPNAVLFPLVDNPSQLGFAFPALGGAAVPQVINGVPTGALVGRVDRMDNSKLTNTRVTWRGALEFDAGPRSLLYASVETGYRSGGFNAATGFETYQPESITAYTVGAKNRFFDNRLQINVEAFWWEYRNQQISAVRLDNSVPIPRTANITQNIGSSRIRGAEVEGRLLITPTTLFSTDIQYLDAKNTNFTYVAQNSGTPPLTGCASTLSPAINSYLVNCSGLPAYNSPRWTLNFSVQQTVPLGGYKLVLGADTQYKTSRYLGFNYLAQQDLPAVWRTNAQISFGPEGDRWSISAFVRNIEDKRTPTYSSVTPIANTLAVGTTAPRTYGARIGDEVLGMAAQAPRLIASEEAFAPRPYIDEYLKLARTIDTPVSRYLQIYYQKPEFVGQLVDVDARLPEMDRLGVAMHLLGIAAPGTQAFGAEAGAELAIIANDMLAATVGRHPLRFAGLAAIAPHAPEASVREIERAMTTLGLRGLIINSHTHGAHLDDPRFWPILEAAAAFGAPIYLHPNFPPPDMIAPYESYGMMGALWGFQAECSLHVVRMIMAGVFDRFPALQLVLGHLGEGLPYWLDRLDNRYQNILARGGLSSLGMVELQRLPSDYVRQNIHVTTSGMNTRAPFDFCLDVLGPDRVLFATDFPFERGDEAVAFMRSAPLSDDVMTSVTHGNAERLFGISPL